MLHPDTALRYLSPALGYGVVATRLIPLGTIVWVLDPLDQIFTPEEISQMDEPYLALIDKWTYNLANGDFVLNWDLARYFNHSCMPSCMNAGMSFEFAVRDIAPGEELNDDYGMLSKALQCECRCGSPQCRRDIRADDLLRHASRWDDVVRAAFPSIAEVEQPLWSIVKEKDEIRQALADPARIPSCIVNYFPGAGGALMRHP